MVKQLNFLMIRLAYPSNVIPRLVPTVIVNFSMLLVLLSIGCAREIPPIKDWEHSSAGLFQAAISNNGDYGVVSSFSEGTSFWDLRSNQRLYDWQHQPGAENAIGISVFATDDTYVLTADSRTFVIWSVSNGKAQGYWSVDSDILAAAMSDGAAHILLGLKDGRALHINRATGRRLEVIAHRNEWVTSVALSADGRIALTGGNDKRAVAWNAFSGEEIGVFNHSHRIVKVALSNDQRRLLSADENANAYIWSLTSGSQLTKLNLKRNELHIVDARFSKSGDEILIGFPGRNVSLWSTASGNRLHAWLTPARKFAWTPQGSTVYAVAFADNENAIIAQSSNGLGGKWKLL